jgi:S1-C subfamily serine protease
MDSGDSSFHSGEPFEGPDGYWGEQEEFGSTASGGIPEGLIGDEGLLRGWIPPDDRLWLHPSEVGRGMQAQASGASRTRSRRPDRRGVLAAGIVGTAALTAAVAAVVLAATTSNPVATSSSTPHLTSSVTQGSPVVAAPTTHSRVCTEAQWMSSVTCKGLQRLEPSLLQVIVRGPSKKTTDGTAVVVSSTAGAVAITAASLIGSSSSVEAVGPTGLKKLDVLGVDASSGVAVLKVPWANAEAAPISDASTLPGYYVLACLGKSSDDLVPAMGQVYETDSDTPRLMDAIIVDISKTATAGGVLLDTKGEVLGILGATQHTAQGIVGEFVPSWLAVGVADQIAASHKVTHGWLDVEGTNANDPLGGALVVSVPADGPAALAGLKPNDIVIGISTAEGIASIASMADLRGRLYLEPPGARVVLEIMRNGQKISLSSVLTGSLP